jgi:hypothetical protein
LKADVDVEDVDAGIDEEADDVFDARTSDNDDDDEEDTEADDGATTAKDTGGSESERKHSPTAVRICTAIKSYSASESCCPLMSSWITFNKTELTTPSCDTFAVEFTTSGWWRRGEERRDAQAPRAADVTA